MASQSGAGGSQGGVGSSQAGSNVPIGSASQDYIAEVIEEHNRKAPVWEHFNLVKMFSGKRRAQCRHCSVLLTAEGNSTLKRHIENTCPALKAMDASQPTLTPTGEVWIYNAEICRMMQAKLVIQLGLPFGHFDNIQLTRWIQTSLQPRYRQVSRSTLKRDCFKLWKIAQTEMVDLFSNLQTCVALTCDVWSAPHGLPQSYLCVTAHWIDPTEWLMIKRTIAFEQFGYPHGGNDLYKIMKHIIEFYHLSDKIFSVSFDNASNNNVCVEKLKLFLKPICGGIFFHTRCVAHIINLSVQAGMKIAEKTLEKFRLMIKLIFYRGKLVTQSYYKYCQEVHATAYKPSFDMPVRWNSTHKMLERIYKQKETIQSFYNNYFEDNDIVEQDWVIADFLIDSLEVFKNATEQLSGVYYPTSSLVLKHIYIMAEKLKEYENTSAWKRIVKHMRKKLIKYFSNLPPVFTCAAVLNPTINVAGVELLINDIADALGLTEDDQHFATRQIENFKSVLYNLFDIYSAKFGKDRTHIDALNKGKETSTSSGSGKHKGKNIALTLYNNIVTQTTKRQRTSSDHNELRIFSDSNFLAFMTVDDFDHLDILAWWKEKEGQFPILAAMAKDLLTVQASTVASESAFSFSGRVLTERRTRLTPESLEVCVCLKDYLDSYDRIQDTSSLEKELPYVDEQIEDEEGSIYSGSPPSFSLDGEIPGPQAFSFNEFEYTLEHDNDDNDYDNDDYDNDDI